MQELFSKLESLVRDYPDPTLKIYVVENLGKPIHPQSKYYPVFMQYRNEISMNLVASHFNPQRLWALRHPANRFAVSVKRAREQLEFESRQVAAMQKAVQEAEYKAFMLRQLEQMAKQAD